MTIIKATCPNCDEVELNENDIKIIAPSTHLSRYEFVCPLCHNLIRKPADDHIVKLLLSSGVEVIDLEIPLEVFEIHTGPKFTYDDLLDFRLALGGAADIAALADTDTPLYSS